MIDAQLTFSCEATNGARERSVVDVTESFVLVERVDGHQSSSAHVTPVLGTTTWGVLHFVPLQDRTRVRRVVTRAALVPPFTLQ